MLKIESRQLSDENDIKHVGVSPTGSCVQVGSLEPLKNRVFHTSLKFLIKSK